MIQAPFSVTCRQENTNYKTHFLKMFMYLPTTNPHRHHDRVSGGICVFTLGGEYAFRLSQVSLDREDPDFFDNDAHLYILRSDLRVWKHWEGSVEGRLLDLPDLGERRNGALVTVYRHMGDHFEVGVGYNFTNFSEDLTDLSYDEHGGVLNMIGTF